MDKKILAKQKMNNVNVFNILKRLGIKSSNIGTKYIISTLLIGYKQYPNYLNMEKIYIQVANIYHVSTQAVKTGIKYSLDHRDYMLAKKNFESIFGYEYNEYTFMNKEFFEEVFRVISVDY